LEGLVVWLVFGWCLYDFVDVTSSIRLETGVL
jgi:hypothetical protein